MHNRKSSIRILAAFIICVLAAGVAKAQPKVNQNALTLQEFDKGVAEYMKLRKSVEGQLPRLKPTPSQDDIKSYEKSLAGGIRKERPQAARGDIFTPAVGAEFRHLIGLMQGAKADRVKKSMKSAEPVAIALRINDIYPSTVPLQSTPPTLLQNLPKLPPELDYRVVGHDLVLRDMKANLVIDILPNVIP